MERGDNWGVAVACVVGARVGWQSLELLGWVISIYIPYRGGDYFSELRNIDIDVLPGIYMII
jgi:divalent metal cation (Fe/Co/Zn/Cd) transporter